MKIDIGERIKTLRCKCANTQEKLAAALGVTPQAVSRWEAGGSYPDMELIPSIANYFGISIDELFGYQNDRDKKIDAIIQRVNAFCIKSRADDDWVDECLSVLREGLAEFPQNERLLIALADTLSEAGWRRYQEWQYYDKDDYIRHDIDVHEQNPYWAESIKICEMLVNSDCNYSICAEAIAILVTLYCNIGEYEKAVSYAGQMPDIRKCREVLLAKAEDGQKQARYIGELLLKMADIFSEQMVRALMVNKNHYKSDMPIAKIKGAISLYDLLCDDGNYGLHNDNIIKLYLYLSRLEWERGYHDGAFNSLDKALSHARALEAVCDGGEHYYTAQLISQVAFTTEAECEIARYLPEDWPFWHVPDYANVERGIMGDPRWEKWVTKCKS